MGVGECRLREGCVFSFICVDCGLFVGDIEEDTEVSETLPRVEVPSEPLTSAFESSARFLNEADDAALQDLSEEVGEEEEADAPDTAIEVVNRTEDPANIKIFKMIVGGHAASRLFRSAVAEGNVG